jgi:serine/threonine-protein kinase
MDVADPHVGRQIAGYTVEGVLGRGGMGVVYVARQRYPERQVALKLLNATIADDPAFRERFLREARAAAAIEHPHILPVYDAGEADGVLYLVTRLIDGRDLSSVLRLDAPLEPDRAAEIVAQIASALDAAHARGLVHRDVKPGNILVTRPGDREEEFCYLTDFGVSAWTSDPATTLTETGGMVGTLNYIAPEQVEGSRAEPASDVYSLGCVLVECVTGEPPFSGRGPAATLYAHLHDAPPRVSSGRAGVPTRLDDVVDRALAKDPSQRYATARAFADAVRSAVGSSRSASDTTVRTPAVPAPERPRRRVLIAGAVAASVAVAAIVVAIVLLARPASGPGGDGAPPRAPLVDEGIQVAASSTAPASTDGAGNIVTYVPANAIDGRIDTAWRAVGDGRGVTLTLIFDNAIDVARIGLIPGYAKSDPATGVNRFEQNRIIEAVRYELPGRAPIEQRFRPEDVPQYVHVGATTRRITIEIEATTEPGGGPRFDFTAISEIYVYGTPQ